MGFVTFRIFFGANVSLSYSNAKSWLLPTSHNERLCSGWNYFEAKITTWSWTPGKKNCVNPNSRDLELFFLDISGVSGSIPKQDLSQNEWIDQLVFSDYNGHYDCQYSFPKKK